MSPKYHILTLYFSLLLLFISLHCFFPCSESTTPQEDYDKWLKWNVENHHEKKLAHSQPNSATLDLKLQSAELNKVTLKINQDGTGDYNTITDAIDNIPIHNTRRVILQIGSGIYREKILIPKTKPFITFVGNTDNPPTITGNDTASVTRGGTPLRTFHSATVAIDADYFVALNIIFENTAPHEGISAGEQGVALRISGNKTSFFGCSFYGSQDTLYDHKGLHYFSNCFIQGSVDFIFGYGRSLYENCTLNSIAKNVASITAQKRSTTSMLSGFSFKNSKVTGSGLVYLGRAWGDYSRVVYSLSFLDKIIIPDGWNNWGKSKRNRTVYYGEYKCSGPGSNISRRVPWARALTDQEAEPFLGTYYVEGDTWIMSPSA